MCSSFTLQMDDVRDWANDNEALQTLRGAIHPVKTWIKVRNRTFRRSPKNNMKHLKIFALPRFLLLFVLFYPYINVHLFVLQEKADTVKDKTFSDLYEGVKSSVQEMDHKIGTWLDEKTG